MNNSFKSQWGINPVGFVYFDNSPNKTANENLDYIEFSNSRSPTGNTFSPAGCSSPQQFRQRNSSYYKGNRNNRNFNRFHNSGNFKHSRNSSNNSHSSYSPYENNRSPRKYQQFCGDKGDISLYYDPSMMEDPWAELERELESNSQNDSENLSESFNTFEVESLPASICEDNTDSQDESQVSTEESS